MLIRYNCYDKDLSISLLIIFNRFCRINTPNESLTFFFTFSLDKSSCKLYRFFSTTRLRSFPWLDPGQSHQDYSILCAVDPHAGGNPLVIAVIYRKCNLRTVINFLILSMAISHLLVPIFAFTRRIKLIYLPRGEWPLDGVIGSITCKFRPFAAETSLTVSVLTLEVIALERFFSVVFPLKRQLIRSNKTRFIVIAFMWLIGTLYPSMQTYTFHLDHRGTIPYCTNSWEPAFDHSEAVKLENTIFLVAFTIIPFLLLTSLYSAIIIFLHRQKANLHLDPPATQRRAKKYRRITYMLVTVVVVFLVLWLPLNFYGFLTAFVWSSHRPCESRHLIFSAVFFGLQLSSCESFHLRYLHGKL